MTLAQLICMCLIVLSRLSTDLPGHAVLHGLVREGRGLHRLRGSFPEPAVPGFGGPRGCQSPGQAALRVDLPHPCRPPSGAHTVRLPSLHLHALVSRVHVDRHLGLSQSLPNLCTSKQAQPAVICCCDTSLTLSTFIRQALAIGEGAACACLARDAHCRRRAERRDDCWLARPSRMALHAWSGGNRLDSCMHICREAETH